MVNGSNIQRIVLAYISLLHFVLLQVTALYVGYFCNSTLYADVYRDLQFLLVHIFALCVGLTSFCGSMAKYLLLKNIKDVKYDGLVKSPNFCRFVIPDLIGNP